MGLLAHVDREVDKQRAPGPLDDFWYPGQGDGPEISEAGIRITPQGAMRISTFWKCVRWRSQQFGMLPKKLFERTTILGRPAMVAVPNHPLHRMVNRAPNPMMPSMAFFEYISADLDTDGNFYAWIQLDFQTGKPQHLWRIRPDRVRIEVSKIQDESGPGGAKWRLWYLIWDDQGNEEKFFPDEILHIPGLGYDGIKGYSPVRMQMDSLGWHKGAMRYGAQFFKKASRPSGLIISPQAIKDPAVRQNIINSLKATGKNAGSLVLIEGGLSFEKISMDQDEAQFIETVQWQEEDVCGIMNTKPHKVGIMRHMTNNNVEQQNIEAVTDSLQPLAVRVEQWMDLQLLSDVASTGVGGGTERERFFFHTELKGLLRGDTKAQTAHVKDMIDRGVYSQNDGLDFLGMPPVEGGDHRWINSAYVTLEIAAEGPKEPVAANDNEESGGATARSYIHVFRDAVGRVMSRPSKQREQTAVAVFERPIMGLVAAFGLTLSPQLLTNHLHSIGLRSSTWSDVDIVTSFELDRAINLIKLKGIQEAVDGA